jgi:small-conductance mechanosensitive channel
MATRTPAASRADAGERSPAFGALIGLTTLAVLLQGLWAGIFLEHDGKREASSTWIDVHAAGGAVARVLALAATVVAFLRLRSRTDLVMGSATLAVLLILEYLFGKLISDSSKDALTAVHIPLAMLIMGLAVWLPVRARHSRGHLPGE